MKTHFLLPFALLLALSGCGEKEGAATTDGSPSQAKALPPCQLVTAADVQAVFGNQVETMADEPETCTYNSKGAVTDVAPFTMLIITLTPNADEAEARDAMQMMLKMQGFIGDVVNDAMTAPNTHALQTLDGVGDEAYLSKGNLDLMSNTQLTLRKGRMVLNMGAIGLKGDAEAGKLETLARQVAPRL
jgi:hypothetical protein